MTPIVSVILPTYNRQDLTIEAIHSVRTEQPSAVEIVVVDDAGPTPFRFVDATNSSGVAIRLVRLETNCGAGVARSVGVEAADGEIVAFLDSDDGFGEGWIDALLELYAQGQINLKSGAMIVGMVENPQYVASITLKLLRILPERSCIICARLISLFFNPFYTPSIAITKTSARFHQYLRYCEDYFMVSVSLFNVDRLLIPGVVACRLGRPPNSQGGASAQDKHMRRGESLARRAIANSEIVPIWYRLLSPIGFAYQWLRIAIKALIQRWGFLKMKMCGLCSDT